MVRVRSALLVALLGLAALAGCRAILGLDDPTVEVADAATPDVDVSSDTDARPPAADAGGDAADAGPDVVVTYNENWNDPTLWNSVDLTQINLGVSSFTGAVFDGRYIYFAPSNNTLANAYAARYDTASNALTLVQSWKFFDTASLNPNARGFEGAVFDGRYVYFVPYANATEHVGLMTRYDTQTTRDFNDPLAWSTYDVTAINPYAKGFMGGAYDGKRYVYFAPGYGVFDPSGRPQSIAARYDTTAPFDAPSSWQMFDTKTADALEPRGFFGTVLTATHLYLLPYGYDGQTRGRVVRYDLSKPFTTASSWELFDTTTVEPGARGFQGGAYDGRRLYLVPFYNETDGFHGKVALYDTQQPFADAGSWAVQNVKDLDGSVAPGPPDDGGTVSQAGYVGAGFDGRYVYLSPDQNSGFQGWIARYDTTAPVDAGASWSFFDATRTKINTVEPNAVGFSGAVFDGKYMYFVPGWKSVVVRFYAKYPAQLPPRPFAGSFL